MKGLASAIVVRALKDYKYLVDNGLDQAFSKARGGTGELCYSRSEIEHFIQSKWCGTLFTILDYDLDTEAIINGLYRYAGQPCPYPN